MCISLKSEYSHCWLSLLNWDLIYCKYCIRDKNSVNKKIIAKSSYNRASFLFTHKLVFTVRKEVLRYCLIPEMIAVARTFIIILFLWKEPKNDSQFISRLRIWCCTQSNFKLYKHPGFKGVTGVVAHNELWKMNREKVRERIRYMCHRSVLWVSTRHYLQVLSSVFNLFEVLNGILCSCTRSDGFH